MQFSRPPAVAGLFYPSEKYQLQSMVQSYLDQAKPKGGLPKAIIAPHAGYIYSGAVAASVYARLAQGRGKISQVVLLGPSHRFGFKGLALSTSHFFTTPLGEIPLETEAANALCTLPFVHKLDKAHAQEHSLEVQLPFLQEMLGSFYLLPIVVGDASPEQVAEVLDKVWGGDETLIVISSDLSHYHDYATARRLDTATSRAIVAMHPEAISFEDACGRLPICGLLIAAQKRKMKAENIDLRNSGDTAGSKDRVVGYGAYVFE